MGFGKTVLTSLLAVLSLVLAGCQWPDIPIPPVPPLPPPTPPEPPATVCEIQGVMATDYLCMPKLEKVRGKDMDIFREHCVNTIYAVADLPLPVGARRPYIKAARSETKVTDQFVRNVEAIHRHGLKVMVAMANEPSVRHGHSRYMAGLGFRRVNNKNMYSEQWLRNEEACWRDALQKCKIEYAVPVLEVSTSQGREKVKRLAYYLSDLDPHLKIFISCVGRGKWNGDPARRIYSMPSIHHVDYWKHVDLFLKCNDGMPGLHGGTASSWIPQMVKHPGRLGWVLWYADYRGGSGGPGKLKEWHYKYLCEGK